MKSRLLVVLAGLGVLSSTTPLSAHHSTAMYNMASPSTGGAAKSGAPAMLSSLIKLQDGRMIKS
jgi:hypothetical protein